MQFERTQDWELIKRVATHPKVYPHITDDFCPEADDWQPIKNNAVWYVMVKEGDILLGMFAFVPENAICWKIHTCLLPNAYGGKAREITKQLGPWLWANSPCRRVITDVPDYNRLALKFSKDSGLEPYGYNPDSYMKHGRLYGQHLLGMSKP